MQALQLDVQQAIEEAAPTACSLADLAIRHREQHTQPGQFHTTRHWESSAGTWCYQTHIAVGDQPGERLGQLTRIFFNAANLPSQPWYPQFQGGQGAPLDRPPPQGIRAHQLTLGQFELGLPAPRYYRQLISLAQPDAQTSVIVARSVCDGPALPPGGRLAYTLAPNGEVLHWEGGRLHWHHICCTPGAGVLPGVFDRWFINLLRGAGLDKAERNTYRQEAEMWRDWLSSDKPELIDS